LGQAAPEATQAEISALNCACVPGAGSRVPPGLQFQPTKLSRAMCSSSWARVRLPLQRLSLICSQIGGSDLVCYAVDFGAMCQSARLGVPRVRQMPLARAGLVAT
jgi:hypothetical protein